MSALKYSAHRRVIASKLGSGAVSRISVAASAASLASSCCQPISHRSISTCSIVSPSPRYAFAHSPFADFDASRIACFVVLLAVSAVCSYSSSGSVRGRGWPQRSTGHGSDRYWIYRTTFGRHEVTHGHTLGLVPVRRRLRGLERLRKNSSTGSFVGEMSVAGAKAQFILLALSVRANSCPYYKAPEVEFSRSLWSHLCADGCPVSVQRKVSSSVSSWICCSTLTPAEWPPARL